MTFNLDTFPGREINFGRKKYLYFGGTAYLGLQNDKNFQDLLIRNIRLYGTNYGASRKSNVRISIYPEVEKFLAAWTGSEAALTLSSGYLAGQLVCSHFNREQYRLFHAPNSHSALFLPANAKARVKSYVTYTSLNIALREHLSRFRGITPVVCLDSIDFSGSNYPHFEGLSSLPLNDLIVVADDSHGIGIVGPDGSGVYSLLSGLGAKEVMVCCSLGKALGIQGGALLGSRRRLDAISESDVFGGASPAAPAFMASLIEGKELIIQKRQILEGHMQLAASGIQWGKKLSHVPGHPTYGYADTRLTKHLENNRIIVTDFSYPVEDAGRTSRIVITASHKKEDIVKLTKSLDAYFKDTF